MPPTYFAALPPYSPAVASAIMQKVDRWYEVLPNLRTYQRARNVRQHYFGLPSDASPFDATMIAEAGGAGELSAISVNQLGSLGQRLLSMTIQDDLGWQPVAANMDAASQKDTAIARAVLDAERRTGQLDHLFAKATETAFLDSSAFLAVRWDVRGGPVYETNLKDPDTGAPLPDVHAGKLRVTLHPWWRTPIDLYRRDADHEWIILVDYVNKFDLSARFAPGREDENLRSRILGLSREHHRILQADRERGSFAYTEDTALVPVYTLHHRPSPAVKRGREIMVVDSGTVLYDGDAVYGEELPVVRIAPKELLDTPHGDSHLNYLCALQDGRNMALSSVLTNNANGAVSNVWVRSGAELKRTQWEGGLLWEGGEAPPEVISTVGSAPETYKLADVFKDAAIETVGLNPSALGQREGQMSGSLAVLLDAKAREGNAPVIRSYRWMVENVGTRIIQCYKKFATTPRALEVLVGQERRYMLKDFTGRRLEPISRVSVEARASMLDTTSGKLAFLERLEANPLYAQLPQSLQILYSVFNTGRIDPLLLQPEQESILIASENELLMRGIEPVIRWDDPDEMHLAQHRKVASNPEAREDEELMAVYEAHRFKHEQQLMEKQAGALGPGMVPPPAPGMGQPALPPGAPAGAPPGSAAPEQPVDAPAMDVGPGGPGLPSMPINPETGQRAPLPSA